MKVKKAILFLLINVLVQQVYAQEPFLLKILDTGGQPLKEIAEYQKSFTDSLERHKQLQNVLSELYGSGYLAASFDSLNYKEKELIAIISKGEVYKWASINANYVDEGILSKIGYRDKLFYKKPFNHNEVRKLQEALLTYCENNGHPFAIVQLDSIKIKKEKISAVLSLKKNQEIKIDSIAIIGDANISRVFLYNFIGISPGNRYNEKLIRNIRIRMKELRFAKETKPVQVEFSEKHTKLVLHIEGVNASQFNGVVGFMPNTEPTEKLLVNGEARVKLLNSLENGELLDIYWRSLEPGTQDLKSRLIYPFLFSSPFGTDLKFTLYKKDTLYIDLISSVGLQYFLRRGNFLKAFVNNKESRLIRKYSSDNPYGNVRSTIYGIGYKSQKLDYLFNPTKGYSLILELGAGNKKIKSDQDLSPDSLELRSTEFEGELIFDCFIPLAKRNVLNIGIAGGYRANKSMFENELYRLGGISTLRGFDEESILASAYSVFTIEYRYLLEQNSYLYLFFDGSYYENEVKRHKGMDWVDYPVGYGAGISFETKLGIFSINYAFGQQKGNPADPKAAKVHFGIVNRF